jgi:formylglycine-generating enzyme required for sulfatase activity
MQSFKTHRKENIIFLGGGFVVLLLVFAGVFLFRAGIIGTPKPTAVPTKDVAQVVMEMNATSTAQVVGTQKAFEMATAVSVQQTANAPTPTLTPTATPEPPLGTTRTSPVDGMLQVFVPSGTFLMGSTDADTEAELQEKPQHSVFLNGYWIDQTEVTQGMFKRCIASGTCPDVVHDLEQNPNYENPEYDSHPAVYVTWDQARTYCERVGRRLPTEAEWEKAARGTDGRLYPWGETPPSGNQALFDKAMNGTRDVGSYPDGMSPYGVLDMIGNVREWVFDIYSEYYYGDEFAQFNPQGPEESEDHNQRVLRGAGWTDAVHYTRAAMRFHHVPWSPGDNRGFRCAATQ